MRDGLGPGEDLELARGAELRLREAGAALEEARQLVVQRAVVALAAGVDIKSAARAAGLDPRTLRAWVSRWEGKHRRAPALPERESGGTVPSSGGQ